MIKKENPKNEKNSLSCSNDLVLGAELGDFKSLSKLITLLEKQENLVFKNKKLLDPPFLSFRIGLTGSPGAGKSTLTEKLIEEFRKSNLKIGVLTVDPSSFLEKGGALLGDRIRYNRFTTDPNVFIRSMGSRGAVGGLSSACSSILRAYDLSKFDISIIETTGVGQTEGDIFYVADEVSLLLTPESGDTVQFMKAGLLEIAHQFIINKIDLKGVNVIEHELKELLTFDRKKRSNHEKREKIFKIEALTGKGVKPLAEFYIHRLKKLNQNKKTLNEWKKMRHSPLNLQKEAYFLAKKEFDRKILKDLKSLKTNEDLKNFFYS